jgi:hypothetical protein
LAASHEAIGNQTNLSIAANIRREVANIMEHPGNTRTPLASDDPDFAGVMVTPTATMPRLNRLIRSQDDMNRDFLSGAGTHAPTESRRAGLGIRRLLNRGRDQALAQMEPLDPGITSAIRQQRDRFATSATVSPPSGLSVNDMHAPTLTRRLMSGAGATTGASIGGQVAGPLGAVVGGGAGGLGGYMLGNAAKEYEWAIIAAMNGNRGSVADAAANISGQLLRRVQGRPGYQGAQTVEAVRDIAERIGDAEVTALADEGLNLIGRARRVPAMLAEIQRRIGIDPAAFGRHSATLEDAARRGILPNVLSKLLAEDPAVAGDIDAVLSVPEYADEYMEAHPELYNPDAPLPPIPPVETPGGIDDIGDVDDAALEYMDEHPELYGTRR